MRQKKDTRRVPPYKAGVTPKKLQARGVSTGGALLEAAHTRTEQAELRVEQAKMRAERAETRTEQAESRTEMAKTRAEQAETRSEQAETRAEQVELILKRIIHQDFERSPAHAASLPGVLPLKNITTGKTTTGKGPLEKLSLRQREILQLIAEGQNTKQIGDILKISPKTVEYHRMKLMNTLQIHDVPGLVRIAMRAGLIPPEKSSASSAAPVS
jgi:DNA-binding CsgD family transcriptional regulator